MDPAGAVSSPGGRSGRCLNANRLAAVGALVVPGSHIRWVSIRSRISALRQPSRVHHRQTCPAADLQVQGSEPEQLRRLLVRLDPLTLEQRLSGLTD